MNILVLCTGNSARSILLESILSHRSDGRITGFSAGSKPSGKVHPQSLVLLAEKGFPVKGLSSQSWDVYAAVDAPVMDAVITVCGSAAGETCPIWPGAPVRAHWGVEDPAAAAEPDWDAAFKTAFDRLSARADELFALPLDTLSQAELQAALTGHREPPLMQKIAAEALGTAILLVSVVGSGIMAATLTEDIAVALLANAIATGCALYFLITILGPISGAHFNPAVTLAFLLRGEIALPLAGAFVAAQVIGGVLGVWATHLMFDLPVWQFSTTDRTGFAQYWSEGLATFGLLFVIFGGLRSKPDAVPTLVALYITGAYWFTSSTSFANPAVTIARTFSDTFAGINPAHAPMFIVMQIVAVGVAALTLPRLFAKD